MRRWLPLLLAVTLIAPVAAQDVRRAGGGTDYSYTILTKTATY